MQKGKVFTTLIFCLLESFIYLPISLSLLETGQRNSRFLFLLSKLEKRNSGFSFSSRNWARKFEISLSPLETRQRDSVFSFSSRNWRNGIQISLSPLEIGEIVFEFLFLFSIGLFCLSSMTAHALCWLPSPGDHCRASLVRSLPCLPAWSADSLDRKSRMS